MIEPYTTEWWQTRLGKVTASRIADVVARLKNGEWGASRGNYAAELIAERLTGNVAASYSNAAMEWGTATEPLALAAYRFFTDREAIPCGWVPHPEITYAGATPDGAVWEQDCAFVTGLVEIKCPNTRTHIDTLRRRTVQGDYYKQCLWQLACVPTAEWVDFISFDPRMPEELQLFVKRVWRDVSASRAIAELEDAVVVFLYEIEKTISELWAGGTVREILKQSLEVVE